MSSSSIYSPTIEHVKDAGSTSQKSFVPAQDGSSFATFAAEMLKQKKRSSQVATSPTKEWRNSRSATYDVNVAFECPHRLPPWSPRASPTPKLLPTRSHIIHRSPCPKTNKPIRPSPPPPSPPPPSPRPPLMAKRPVPATAQLSKPRPTLRVRRRCGRQHKILENRWWSGNDGSTLMDGK